MTCSSLAPIQSTITLPSVLSYPPRFPVKMAAPSHGHSEAKLTALGIFLPPCRRSRHHSHSHPATAAPKPTERRHRPALRLRYGHRIGLSQSRARRPLTCRGEPSSPPTTTLLPQVSQRGRSNSTGQACVLPRLRMSWGTCPSTRRKHGTAPVLRTAFQPPMESGASCRALTSILLHFQNKACAPGHFW